MVFIGLLLGFHVGLSGSVGESHGYFRALGRGLGFGVGGFGVRVGCFGFLASGGFDSHVTR